MKKIYHLSTCSTCVKIIKELGISGKIEMQDIKTEAITPAQLEQMYSLTGSYEQLFSKRAMKYRSLGLNEQNLNEDDFKNWILKEYTFLKRPVLIVEDEIFVGNAKKTVEAASKALSK